MEERKLLDPTKSISDTAKEKNTWRSSPAGITRHFGTILATFFSSYHPLPVIAENDEVHHRDQELIQDETTKSFGLIQFPPLSAYNSHCCVPYTQRFQELRPTSMYLHGTNDYRGYAR